MEAECYNFVRKNMGMFQIQTFLQQSQHVGYFNLAVNSQNALILQEQCRHSTRLLAGLIVTINDQCKKHITLLH